MSIQSQLCETYNAKVLLKSGKQTLELTELGQLVVTDGWVTNWVLLYGHSTEWVQDGVFYINKPIQKELDKLALQEYNKLK